MGNCANRGKELDILDLKQTVEAGKKGLPIVFVCSICGFVKQVSFSYSSGFSKSISIREMKVVVMVLLLLKVSALYAQESYEKCFSGASMYYNVPISLLEAIASAESSGKPLALNINGNSYFPNSVDEALKLLDTDKSFDIGLMQINRWWFDRYGYKYELGLDACWNIKMGAYILAYEISRHEYSWESVARYHSPTKHYQDRYIKKIALFLPNIQ